MGDMADYNIDCGLEHDYAVEQGEERSHECYGTKEYSERSRICKRCPEMKECGEARKAAMIKELLGE